MATRRRDRNGSASRHASRGRLTSSWDENTAKPVPVGLCCSGVRMVQNAMACDFSWQTQANEYLKLFAELLQLDAAALVERNPAQKAAR